MSLSAQRKKVITEVLVWLLFPDTSCCIPYLYLVLPWAGAREFKKQTLLGQSLYWVFFNPVCVGELWEFNEREKPSPWRIHIFSHLQNGTWFQEIHKPFEAPEDPWGICSLWSRTLVYTVKNEMEELLAEIGQWQSSTNSGSTSREVGINLNCIYHTVAWASANALIQQGDLSLPSAPNSLPTRTSGKVPERGGRGAGNHLRLFIFWS